MIVSKFKLLIISLILSILGWGGAVAFAQDIDLDSLNKEIKDKEQAKFKEKIETNGQFQLITGLGIQLLNWNYDATNSIGGGKQAFINENSQYIGLIWNTKFIAFRPWGLVARLGFFFPLTITESVWPNTTKNGPEITNTNYILKNVKSNTIGFGFDLLLGPNFELSQRNISVNFGGGLAWISYFEDLGVNDRHVSMLGMGLDIDFQWHIKKFFGLSLGSKAEYYMFTLLIDNNTISNYSLTSKYITTLGINIAVSWYF